MQRRQMDGDTGVYMGVVEEVRDSIVPDTGDETTAYRCTDCLAEFDERQQLCPECGSERFDTV